MCSVCALSCSTEWEFTLSQSHSVVPPHRYLLLHISPSPCLCFQPSSLSLLFISINIFLNYSCCRTNWPRVRLFLMSSYCDCDFVSFSLSIYICTYLSLPLSLSLSFILNLNSLHCRAREHENDRTWQRCGRENMDNLEGWRTRVCVFCRLRNKDICSCFSTWRRSSTVIMWQLFVMSLD